MTRQVVYEYSDNMILYGLVKETDESFDHAHGRENKNGYELVDLYIVVTIDGIDEDLTEYYTKTNRMDMYKMFFMNWFSGKDKVA